MKELTGREEGKKKNIFSFLPVQPSEASMRALRGDPDFAERCAAASEGAADLLKCALESPTRFASATKLR